MALLLFLYSPPPYYDKTYYYSLLQMIAAIFFDTLRVNVGKRSIFSLYFFVKIPPQEKKSMMMILGSITKRTTKLPDLKLF
jgi:hypothetical protein